LEAASHFRWLAQKILIASEFQELLKNNLAVKKNELKNHKPKSPNPQKYMRTLSPAQNLDTEVLQISFC